METCLGLDVVCEVGNTSHDDNRQIKCLHRSWLCCDSSFNLGGVELGKADADTVTLLDTSDRLPKHLHRLDLLILFQSWKFNSVPDSGCSSQDCPSDDSALALDLETVINGEEEVLLGTALPIWDLDRLQDRRDQIIDALGCQTAPLVDCGLVTGRHRDDPSRWAKL